MIQYPISFFAEATSTQGINSTWTTDSAGLELSCAIPREFEGPGGAFSPEDFFAQALTNCFLATFKVYAEKSKLKYNEVSAHTELVVDTDEGKKPIMKSAKIKAVIRGAESPERAKHLADRAFKSGFILNSVKTELHFECQHV